MWIWDDDWIVLIEDCNDGSNICRLDEVGLINSYFTPENGYYCLDGFDGQVICTCPDNSTTRNRPCRKIFQSLFFRKIWFLNAKKGICDRNPNPCGESSSVVSCTDINLSFSCLCNDGQGGLIVSTKPCGLSFVFLPFSLLKKQMNRRSQWNNNDINTGKCLFE